MESPTLLDPDLLLKPRNSAPMNAVSRLSLYQSAKNTCGDQDLWEGVHRPNGKIFIILCNTGWFLSSGSCYGFTTARRKPFKLAAQEQRAIVWIFFSKNALSGFLQSIIDLVLPAWLQLLDWWFCIVQIEQQLKFESSNFVIWKFKLWNFKISKFIIKNLQICYFESIQQWTGGNYI